MMRDPRPDYGLIPWVALALVLAFVLYAGLSTEGTPLPHAPSAYLDSQ